ncbi:MULTISPECIES: extensin family protein [unclassified Sphingomonas]|jgi:hypothetical protein|uniref:extensin family protein n=1 Tax=unclassified Sphingomonas TaxID=196159 RepID=UPI00082FF6ED|nr:MULTISPECIES: extensin family protein [unclassified Sphingomonas]
MIDSRTRWQRRALVAVTLAILLASCAGERSPEPPPRPAIRPRASGPVPAIDPDPAATRACMADLTALGVRYSPLPDRDYGSGCIVTGAIQLLDYGTPTVGLKSMRCPLARHFVAWVFNGVRPAARQILGSDVVRVETFGTYSCRGINGGGPATAGKISQHGLANAVDVAAFVLADGRRVSVEQGWRADDPQEQEFLRIVHRSACRRFTTVLGPEYNSAHYNHFHFDLGGKPFCR